MVTGSKELIRDINTTLVIRTIMDKGPISRADISKELGLTKATISAIVQSLLDRSLVTEIGTAKVSAGRKPVLLQFCYDCGYAISVDISSSHITVLTATLGGKNCVVKQFPTKNSRETILSELISAISGQLSKIPESTYGLIGITLGIHGVVFENKNVFTPYSPYEDLDFASTLEEHFQVPVILENEANLSVLGEYTFHYPQKNIIGLSVHNGIGLGILINGSLYPGYSGYAGEFGHSVIEIDGRPCPCGNHGCFEQYASERALLKELALRKKVEKLSADDFTRLYQKNDEDAIDVMNLFVKYMAIGINNILNTLNPELIVINSSFTMNFPDIIKDIEHAIPKKARQICQIVPSGLQDMSILLGGICVSRNLFLNL